MYMYESVICDEGIRTWMYACMYSTVPGRFVLVPAIANAGHADSRLEGRTVAVMVFTEGIQLIPLPFFHLIVRAEHHSARPRIRIHD